MDAFTYLWAVVLLIIYVQVWWAMFGLRRHADWTFLGFLTVLAQTITLYMMAAMALPEEVGDAGVDLGVHYDRQHRWFFGFFLATVVISVVKDVVIDGRLPQATNKWRPTSPCCLHAFAKIRWTLAATWRGRPT